MFMPFEKIQDLSEASLNILCQLDAVITPQLRSVDLKEWFNKFFDTFKEDQEKPEKERKFPGLLDVVFLFVSEEDFVRCQTNPEV